MDDTQFHKTTLKVSPSRLEGKMTIPPSKSHTMRALIFALLAQGKSHIRNFLHSPDTDKMIVALRSLGAKINCYDSSLEIESSKMLRPPSHPIDVGNSGLALRLLGGICALFEGRFTFTGDSSICIRRPIKPLIDAINQLGGKAFYLDHKTPLCIERPIQPGKVFIDGADSQPVSALLIAASFLKEKTSIFVQNPGETPWIDLTLHWLDKFGIGYEKHGYDHYILRGQAQYPGFDITIPGDFSTATFPIVGTLITQGNLEISPLDLSDPQGDKNFLLLLKEMGTNISFLSEKISVAPTDTLRAAKIDMNPFIDALPIAAVLACFSAGVTYLYNARIARKKESDRISAIAMELKKMGAKIIEKEDGLIIYPEPLVGAEVFSHNDHRIALSLAIAGLKARGETLIRGFDCYRKTFPQFIEKFTHIGAKATLCT